MANEKNRDEKIADILLAAGISTLGASPPPDLLYHALDRLGELLFGRDALFVEVCTQVAIATFKFGNYCDAPSAMVRKAIKARPRKEVENEYATYGVTSDGSVIIDIVQRGRALEWVIARPGTGKVGIVETVPDRMKWPRDVLPWEGIPDVRDVEEAWARQVSGREVFLDLADMYRTPPPKRLFVLPDPPGVTAAVLTLWVMGTYLLDQFNYYPELLLEGPHSRGKTRLGNGVIFLARRGMNTSTPTTANIFRHRARHLVSYFFDVYDLPGRMDRDGDFADIVLAAFERDKKVWRVTRPDEPPPHQQEGFTVYGATILASNQSVRDDHPLLSRCLRIRMPEAGDQAVLPALRGREPRVLKLRAELVAWAARWIASGEELPQVPQVLKGRLHDIGSPLLQMARLVYPDCMKAVIKWLEATDIQRRVGESESREAHLISALLDLRREGQWPGEIGVMAITERVNAGKEVDRYIKTQSISWLCKHIGLARAKHGGYSYILYPGDESWKALLNRYGL